MMLEAWFLALTPVNPILARLRRDVEVNSIFLVVDPIPDLVNDPPLPTLAVENRSLNRRSLKDEIVVVSDACDE
jgi:hypothetical protein